MAKNHTYRLEEGRWNAGRPVFKKTDGATRFLFVPRGLTAWAIKDSITAAGSRIVGGRGTNSPTSPEAGPSDREGVTRWRYWDGAMWAEGFLNFSCSTTTTTSKGMIVLDH